jgi:hypothetical protein
MVQEAGIWLSSFRRLAISREEYSAIIFTGLRVLARTDFRHCEGRAFAQVECLNKRPLFRDGGARGGPIQGGCFLFAPVGERFGAGAANTQPKSFCRAN